MVNKIKELSEVKKRNISAILNYNKKFNELYDYLSNTKPIPISILRYIPIFCATNIEAVAKELITLLINYGDNYFVRSKKIIDEKLNVWEVLDLLKGQKFISFGLIVSHSLSIGNIEKVNKTFGTLFEKNENQFFSELLKEGSSIHSTKFMNKGTKNILKKMFYKRHIFVHESSNEKITSKEALNYLNHSLNFINALTSYVLNSMSGNQAKYFVPVLSEITGINYENEKEFILSVVEKIIESKTGEYSHKNKKYKDLSDLLDLMENLSEKWAQFESCDYDRKIEDTFLFNESKKQIQVFLQEVLIERTTNLKIKSKKE